ncbi:phage tail family protein [Clostridium sp. 19966]|uniref:phage tail domain-containing protein n=1 Tax=Clostridium sp. 19966 TaxID=2768166 RepID=UPI0028DF251F|nr:phage tail domain-containing protein [Clostridium sp. 19966]MDT8717601.1 phage tail family protein [Clostridium sp. 19966]
MKYFCLIDDVSCLDIGIKIISRVNIPVAQRDVEEIDIEGRNGSLIRDKGRWLDKEITIAFNFIDRYNFTAKCRWISKWLRGSKLKFSDDLGVFYKIKKVECEDIQRSLRYKGSFSVKFTVDSFAWLEDGQNIITLSSRAKLLNVGTYESKPILKVYGSGSIDLFVNSTEINLNNVSDYVTIDSMIMDCYKDEMNANSQMSGEFPVLQEGENSITWSGNINKIEITPNWVYL